MAVGFAVCALWRLALPTRTFVFEFVYIAFCPHAAAVDSAQSIEAPRSISADMIAAWGMSRCAIRDRFLRPRSRVPPWCRKSGSEGSFHAGQQSKLRPGPYNALDATTSTCISRLRTYGLLPWPPSAAGSKAHCLLCTAGTKARMPCTSASIQSRAHKCSHSHLEVSVPAAPTRIGDSHCCLKLTPQ